MIMMEEATEEERDGGKRTRKVAEATEEEATEEEATINITIIFTIMIIKINKKNNNDIKEKINDHDKIKKTKKQNTYI